MRTRAAKKKDNRRKLICPHGNISDVDLMLTKCCVCVKDSELLPQMPFVAGLLVQCGTQNKTETEGQQKLETRKTEEPMLLLHKTLMRVSL